jgi:hypothetical protein
MNLDFLQESHPQLFPLIEYIAQTTTTPHDRDNPPSHPGFDNPEAFLTIPELLHSTPLQHLSIESQSPFCRAFFRFVHEYHIPYIFKTHDGYSRLAIPPDSLLFSIRHMLLTRQQTSLPLGVGYHFGCDGISRLEATQCFPNAWIHFTRSHTPYLPLSSWRLVAKCLPQYTKHSSLFSRSAFYDYLKQRASDRRIPTDALLSPHPLVCV